MAKPPSFETQQILDALTASRPAANQSKFIIALFRRGGDDSHNNLVPGPGNANLPLYEAARPAGVRITAAEKLALNGTNWALHPSLTHVRDQYNLGNVAYVRECGTLARPITKADFFDMPNQALNRPPRIADHRTQQELWEDGLEHLPPVRETGWFGRTAALLQNTWNVPGGAVVSQQALYDAAMFSMRDGGMRQNRTYAGFGATTLPVAAAQTPRTGMTYGGMTNTAWRDTMRVASEQNLTDVQGLTGNLVRDTMFSILRTSWQTPDYILGQRVDLPADVNTATNNATFLRPTLEAIWTAVNNADLGIRGGVHIINFGGWDHHTGLRANQDPLLAAQNVTLQALTDALALMGLSNRVTIMIESDFSRTFTSNANAGTDHAWAGHYMVMGGAVVGGMYGPEPNYSNVASSDLNNDWSLNAPAAVGRTGRSNRGVFIPRVAIDQYYYRLLRWMGVPAIAIPLILPGWSAFEAQPALPFLPLN
jgi:uncharacterized protein (DUF1501 family)